MLVKDNSQMRCMVNDITRSMSLREHPMNDMWQLVSVAYIVTVLPKIRELNLDPDMRMVRRGYYAETLLTEKLNK